METGTNQCVGNGNREICAEKRDKMAGLSDISEPWLHIRITWGRFSSNIDMLGSTPESMNWNVLQRGSNLSVFVRPPGLSYGVYRAEKLSYCVGYGKWSPGSRARQVGGLRTIYVAKAIWLITFLTTDSVI